MPGEELRSRRRTIRARWTRWARAPLTHFLAAGLTLFAADRWRENWLSVARSARPPLVISAGRVAQAREDFLRVVGHEPSAADQAALLEQAIDEELLYREALAMGLDRQDASIQWLLAEQMSFLGNGDEAPAARPALYQAALQIGLDRGDVLVRRMLVEKVRLMVKHASSSKPVSDDELRDYVGRHADEFREPARVSFWHVFLSARTHGRALDDDASSLLHQLRTGAQPSAGTIRGESFPLAPHIRSQSAAELTRTFGASFADAVQKLEIGSWQGPIPSPSGVHLVWIEQREPAQVSPLESVRARAVLGVRAERQQRDVAAFVARLKQSYTVRVESATEGDA